MSQATLTILRIERLDGDCLRTDAGLWAQGVHIGETLLVEDRGGYTTYAEVERGDDERPVLRCRAYVRSLRHVQVRRVPQERVA